ncbi:SNF2 helicase-associated domain-containing protein [Streptomyces sp. NPDC100445]|uniref:SNF2 helicase-associated domain-containing protein n=1 Tax=Streptomyces sp. NPDC100445 TaxID=3366102 RepID=UPI0037F586AB
MVRIGRECAGRLTRYVVAFEPGDPPRTGRMAFWDPEGGDPPELPGDLPQLPGTVAAEARLVTAQGPRPVPVVRLSVGDALPVLALARREYGDAAVHPAAAFWGAATASALHLAARERLLPGVSAGGHDAWRVGPLDPADVLRLRELAAAAPPEALAVPLPGTELLPPAEPALRAFLDAVVDTLPRTAAAEAATGRAAYAAAEPQHVPHLRSWAERIAVGVDSGVRVSLAVRLGDGADGAPAGQVVPLVSDLADPTVELTATDLFDGAPHALGPVARADTVLAVRRAAAVWEPLARLLPVPRRLDLFDEEFGQLLGGAAARLRAHGVDVHWPEEAARRLTARVTVGADGDPPADMRSFLGGGGTVALRRRFCLDGDPLTEEETAAVADAGRPVVRVRGGRVFVGPGLARDLRDRVLPALTAVEALAVALTGYAEIRGEQVAVADGPWPRALRALLTDPAGDAPVGQPAGLAAPLRDYQARGLHRLVRRSRRTGGARRGVAAPGGRRRPGAHGAHHGLGGRGAARTRRPRQPVDAVRAGPGAAVRARRPLVPVPRTVRHLVARRTAPARPRSGPHRTPRRLKDPSWRTSRAMSSVRCQLVPALPTRMSMRASRSSVRDWARWWARVAMESSGSAPGRSTRPSV